MPVTRLLIEADKCPALAHLVEQTDSYLVREYADFFGAHASHPFLPAKRSKVIHDNLWGTNRFSWRELALIDSPIVQRLRDVHQVGLAYQIYPSARHTRFEHCLGVLTTASRIFDALLARSNGELRNIARAVEGEQANPDVTIQRWRQELRLAAILHDTGHSLCSHVSERVYQNLDNVKSAVSELSTIVGKEKGAGELLSFCIACSPSVIQAVERAGSRLIGESLRDDYVGKIDFANVALLIVGRSTHPFLQFLGDIVSSGFDADKLDYLLRDATAAGLPLRYDIDRYLYSVRLVPECLADAEGELQRLYESIGTTNLRRDPGDEGRMLSYQTYRLRLPKEAMSAIEQIVICKLMLFSYIYHHSKVRAAEGMLEKTLGRLVEAWRREGKTDDEILDRFLRMTDCALRCATDLSVPGVEESLYRIRNRLLPREVYSLSGAAALHAEQALLTDFLTSLQDREERASLIAVLEEAIGRELLKLDAGFAADPEAALQKAGVWVDVPKAPKFEDISELVIGGSRGAPDIPLPQVFPIGEWTQAYTHFRYQVRIFAFSEFWDATSTAAMRAMQTVIKIEGTEFYNRVRRSRQ